MYFDRFDVLEAHWAFCADNYEGNSCPLYWRLCRVQNVMDKYRYEPGVMGMKDYERLSENGKEIYDALAIRFAHTVSNSS